MERIKMIRPTDKAAGERSKIKWNNVAKPLHSLGLLEDAVIKISCIYGSEDFELDKRCAVVMCADNGVVKEGVTQCDSSVTAAVARSMAEGTSNINNISKVFNTDVITVDIGMNTDPDCENLIRRKIAYGTGNIAEGAAMTVYQAKRAIECGMNIVHECRDKGYKIIITGEMGIGNTTTSSAIAAVLLDALPKEVTGRGAGIDSAGLNRKISVIKRAIEINLPDKNKPLELLSKLGGFDIAGMCGLFLGGAVYKIPIVIDGFISAAAAAAAVQICPDAVDYMLCSHVSKEPAGRKLLNYIGLEPLITAGMCLGEGSGGVMLLPLLDAALAVYNSSHKFNNLSIERYVELQ